MNYDDTRDQEQLNQIDQSIKDFIARSGANTGTGRRTVFLFPGGLASRLVRATTSFEDGVAAPQTFSYDPNWITALSFLGGALDLEMKKTAPDVYRDKDDRIMIADGDVDLADILNVFGGDLAGLLAGFPSNPAYHDFRNWCSDNGLDWFVFGWDWRRRIPDAGRFFVTKFLPHFRARVIAAGCADPLADFSLVGHSAGGMVVNWILRNNAPIVATMSKAVTVGAPFYGYAGQIHRWFDGEKLFNGPQGQFKDAIIKMISTLPGCYAWLFLDEATFIANRAALQADNECPLNAYPSLDVDGVTVADPYNPLTKTVGSTLFTRYPIDVNFDHAELADAAELVADLAGSLSAAQQQKFYNIRGIRTNLFGGLVHKTAGSTAWDWIPSAGPVVTNGPGVPGDGTQPGWSARHVELRRDHVVSVEGLEVEHMFMLSSPRVLDALGRVLND